MFSFDHLSLIIHGMTIIKMTVITAEVNAGEIFNSLTSVNICLGKES